MIERSSPNFDERRGCEKPSLVILHYTGMPDGDEALARLCDPAAKVSAHYLVEEDGRLFKLVAEDKRAWHAGVGYWHGCDDINSHSIGIEIVNPGHEFGYRPFPLKQMEALRSLCMEIKTRYGLPAQNFLAHSDIAPLRKTDPGELFDWKFLAEKGIGIWPDAHVSDTCTAEEAVKMLTDIGYGFLTPENFLHVVLAFQRHFTPDTLTGQLDAATAKMLRAVAA
jgi:N-acetylmuramoyl-L-alanine amidase